MPIVSAIASIVETTGFGALATAIESSERALANDRSML